jgi:hypothetical protein
LALILIRPNKFFSETSLLLLMMIMAKTNVMGLKINALLYLTCVCSQ